MQKAGRAWKSKLLLVILWLNFILLWFRVYKITTASDVTDSVNYLGSIISGYGLIVTLWVLHNIHIYRKKGPRQGLRIVNDARTHDSLQNYIMRNADLVRTQEIIVNVVEGRKIFLEASRMASPERELVGTR